MLNNSASQQEYRVSAGEIISSWHGKLPAPVLLGSLSQDKHELLEMIIMQEKTDPDTTTS